MTNHWRDIRHADLILINGANPAEAHPVGFQWFVAAKLDPKRGPGAGGGAKMVHADPRFTRTSAVSDIHARIRTGTDVAYFGGLINYVLSHNLIHHEYVRNYTNASFLVKEGYGFHDGLFSGYDPAKRSYDTATWAYEGDQAATAAFERTQKEIAANGQGPPTNAGAAVSLTKRDMRLEHPRSVFQLMKAHYSRYTPEMVSDITGIPTEQFLEICKLVGEMGRPDKVMTIVYAVGLTQHTTGGQLIRSAALLQLLLGNMGRPGGGMNAERGHANIQGNTDHAISWEILPGYMRIPAPGQKTLNDYVQQIAPKKFDANSWNFFGTNYRNFTVSLLKGWYGDAATKDNEFAFDFVPKPASNSSWISIYDKALKGKMEGVILSGMTATSIGPDSNQVLEALGKLKWLVVMDALPTTSSEFWRRPGADPKSIQTEVFMVPMHALDREGRVVRQQRPLDAVEGAGDPAGGPGPARPLDHGRGLPAREEALPGPGGQVPRSAHGPDHEVQGPHEAGARRDRSGDQRLRPDHREAARLVREAEGRRDDDRRRLDLHGQLPGGRQSLEAAQRSPGPGEERPDGHGLLPQLGLELAAQPARHVQPRLGRPGRASRGIRRDPESPGTPPRRSGSATFPTTRPGWIRRTRRPGGRSS